MISGSSARLWLAGLLGPFHEASLRRVAILSDRRHVLGRRDVEPGSQIPFYFNAEVLLDDFPMPRQTVASAHSSRLARSWWLLSFGHPPKVPLSSRRPYCRIPPVEPKDRKSVV